MRTMAMSVASLLVFALIAARADDKKDDNKTKVVAVWEVVKGDAPKGATVEFTKDGKIKIVIEADGKKLTIDGSYEVEGDSIKTTLKGPDGKDHKETLKIKTLSDTELKIEDEKGKIDEYKKKATKDK